MDRLGAIGSFSLITVLSMLALRGAHLLIGIAYPPSLPGPFELTSLAEVERYTDFSPHIPFYRPMSLGAAPVEIIAKRRPIPEVRVLWHSEALLELTERRGDERPSVPESARALPDHEDAIYWKSGEELTVVLRIDDSWMRIRTDLGLKDVRRIIETLLPFDQLI